MDLGLTDRVAIVTGASRGLGRAEAEALAAEGAAVVVVAANSMVEADRVVGGLRDMGAEAISLQADVRHTAEVRRMVDATLNKFGRLDILVNNAGATGPDLAGSLLDMSEAQWDDALASHLRSVFLCIKYAAPHMRERGWGRIITTSSIHGRVGGRAGFGSYGAAKAGVIALTLTAARELGSTGITANVIAPGVIGTAAVRRNLGAAMLGQIATQIPLGRIGEPPEVGRVVAFLASEAASYLNGGIIDIGGGRIEYFYG